MSKVCESLNNLNSHIENEIYRIIQKYKKSNEY